MRTIEWLLQQIDKNDDDCDVQEIVVGAWVEQLLDEVNQILIDEVRGYEGCTVAIDKINKLKKQL